MGRQYHDEASVSHDITATVAEYRFIAYDGGYATSAGGAKDSRGITHTAASAGETVNLITRGSALIECGEALAQWAYVKPAADGSGKAVAGTATNHCGRLLEAAAGAGSVVECELRQHRLT